MKNPYLIIISLITFIPLYYLPSSAIDSFFIPSNIFLWTVAALSIFIATVFFIKYERIVYPKYFIFLILIPLALASLSFISGVEDYRLWGFRLAGITIAIFFYFSLFQFGANRRTIENGLYILTTGFILHSFAGYLQTLPSYPLLGIIPHTSLNRPLGFFVQPNILSVWAVTIAATCIFLISSPSYKNRKLSVKAIPLLSLFCSGYIVIATGSRIGLIALSVSIPLIFIARYKILSKKPSIFTVTISTLSLGLISGALLTNGLTGSLNKFERLAGYNTETRLYIYKTSTLSFLEAPVKGHGMASFKRVFAEQAASEGKDARSKQLNLNNRLAHPHNEILLWLIEGGVLALSPFIILCALIFKQLIQLGLQRGLAIFSLLAPIAAHTMVEQPFYSSTHQLLVFCIILSLVNCSSSSYKKRIDTRKPSYARITSLCALGLLLLTTLFTTTTFSTSRLLYSAITRAPVSQDQLEAATHHPYFGEIATMVYLKSGFSRSKNTATDKIWARRYAEWLEENIKHNPIPSSYVDLSNAYIRLGDEKRAYKTANSGLYMYPWHKKLQALSKRESQ